MTYPPTIERSNEKLTILIDLVHTGKGAFPNAILDYCRVFEGKKCNRKKCNLNQRRLVVLLRAAFHLHVHDEHLQGAHLLNADLL